MSDPLGPEQLSPGQLAFAYAFAALIGMVIGSFYTATASRVLYYFYGPGRKAPDRWRAFFTRPSFCFACEEPIPRLHLVPLFGYLYTGGRCGRCGSSISKTTLAGEVLPGLLLPAMLATGFSWPAGLAAVLLCGQLYVALATDYYFFALDYENSAFVLLWALLGALALSGGALDAFLIHLYTGGAVLAIFALLFLFARGRGLGLGDLPLAGALGLFFGWPWSLVLFQLAAAGSILYILVIMKDRRAPAPFGLCLALASYATLGLWILYALFESTGWSSGIGWPD